MKKYIIITVTIAILFSGMYYWQDIASLARPEAPRVEYVTKEQVVVTDEFAELVKNFKESREGQEVLHIWATQQALEVQRNKLDEIEKQTLTKEASL